MRKEKEEKEQDGFKVSDRRKFTSEGEVRAEDEASLPSDEGETSRSAKEPPPSPEEDQNSQSGVDFGSFLLSLATTGMVHLGEIPDPTTGQKMENLDGAKQMIEILAMLQKKTQGNLLPEETSFLDSLLYELRMKFLGKTKVIKV